VQTIIFSTIFLLNLITWKIYQSRALDRLLTLCMWAALTMWYCIPAAIVGIYQEQTPFSIFYLYQDNVSRTSWLQDFTTLFFLESLAVFVVLILILFNPGKKQHLQGEKRSNLEYNIDRISPKAKTIILLVGAVMLAYQVANFGNFSDYLNNNSADGYGNADAGSQIIAFVKPISYSMVVLIAIYEQKRAGLIRVAFGQIIFESILTTMSGARIYMLTPFIIFIFRICSTKNSLLRDDYVSGILESTFAFETKKNRLRQREKIRLGVTFFTIMLFLIYVFLPIAKAVGDVRANGEFNLYNVVLDTFVNKKPHASTGQDESKKMEDVEAVFIKLDSFTNGAILNHTSGYGDGGIMPYVGSALVFIPRFILPEKPVAGTSDGTIYTHPSRLVTRSLGIQSDAMNVPSSPLSITFWHFGYYGFAVLILFSFLHLKYLNYLVGSPSFVYKTIGIFSLNLPGFTGVFSAPDVILKDCVTLFVIIYMVDVHRKFTNTVVQIED
jgi:cbb3-type cytochrome oxidase subunit 3